MLNYFLDFTCLNSYVLEDLRLHMSFADRDIFFKILTAYSVSKT